MPHQAMNAGSAGLPHGRWTPFTPKLLTVLKEGYSLAALRADALAGLTVAIVAMPLSMALAIASGVGPERGLFTAVVAGFVISALGGSRVQIGGPTGAFVVVVFDIVARYGYDGLVIATLMAGAMLVAAGALKLGTFIKYVPYPVVTGFTSGIALIIFSSQIGDLLGLTLAHVPGDVAGKWRAYAEAIGTFKPAALGIALLALGIIVAVQRFVPRWPSFLIALAIAGTTAFALHLPIATIGTKFGGIPSMLPAPHLPAVNFEMLRALFPAAFTIFILGGIESLLSAMVADGMTGRRHRSNGELVAQGIANIASACMGGIPATGAIARTATNIRAGGRTPFAGMIHAAAVLAMMMVLAPLVSYVPLAALGSVLVIVCWNMAELDAMRAILRGPRDDMVLLVTTFLLTVLVDLSVAIGVGVVLSAFFFMHRMARAMEGDTGIAMAAADSEQDEADADVLRGSLPRGVEVFSFNGPFFFGAAGEFERVLTRSGGRPRVVILRMENVPLMDATGASILKKFVESVRAHGTQILISGLKPGPAQAVRAMEIEAIQVARFSDALDRARELAAG
jgi:sulfate permease, SulP family